MSPSEISSSYSYESCNLSLIFPNGHSVCVLYTSMIMDVLKIIPPFYYSYQCGSTILITYLPVYMYTISLQILSILGTSLIIFTSTRTRVESHPQWLVKLFPKVCWLSHLETNNSPELELDKKLLCTRIRLLNPHQIISSFINNIALLLSFGLCSPVLCFYLSLSICLHLCHWHLLIGRFVCFRIDTLSLSPSSGSSFSQVTFCFPYSLSRS